MRKIQGIYETTQEINFISPQKSFLSIGTLSNNQN